MTTANTLGILIALASIAMPALAVGNDPFAAEIEGAKPVLWREYEPLNRDSAGCIAGIEPRRLTRTVCAQLNERRSRMLWDALKQAVWLNIVSPQEQRFCAEHATKIVLDQNAIEGGTIAASMIDFQLHGGTGSYGADLPVTYLGKIVYDALVKISPCKQ
jgi:hypothetical protein